MTRSVEQTGSELASIVHDVSMKQERAADEWAQSAMAEYERIEGQAEYRHILGVEADRLINQIKMLHRFKLLARLGGRAVISQTEHGDLATPLLFETEPEDVKSEHVTEGYTFSVAKSRRGDNTLGISR